MSEQSRQPAPPYSEEQVTRWLAFLARGMVEHDQTIFLMENLQPSWLSTSKEQRVYILSSRMIWGIVIALYGWMMSQRMIIELLLGFINGLLFGLLDIVRISQESRTKKRNKPSMFVHIVWIFLSFSLINGTVEFMIDSQAYGVSVALDYGLFVGLTNGVFAPLWALHSFRRTFRNDIHVVEGIRFSWVHFPSSITRAVLGGSVIGLLSGLIIGVVLGLNDQLSKEVLGDLLIIPNSRLVFVFFAGPMTGLLVGLTMGLVGGLIGSFQPRAWTLSSVPNQGIWISLRSAGLMGGVGCFALGVIEGIFGGWTNGLAHGLIAGICIGLWHGGLDVIQHFIVRFLLWRAGSLPWRLAPFLDYAAEELHFLQKVGGGYIFVHRYLLEHFAAMETDTTRPTTPVE